MRPPAAWEILLLVFPKKLDAQLEKRHPRMSEYCADVCSGEMVRGCCGRTGARRNRAIEWKELHIGAKKGINLENVQEL